MRLFPGAVASPQVARMDDGPVHVVVHCSVDGLEPRLAEDGGELVQVEVLDADGKARSASPSPSGFHQYGTFGPPSTSGEFPQPAVGFPQPALPPGLRQYPPPPPASYAVYPPQQPYSAAAPYYAQGYQAVQGYIPVVEGRPVRMRRLPCCGLGIGWFLFIIGFFLAAIPWYIGAFVLICVRVHDYREKLGYIACTIAASLAAIAVLLGVTKGAEVW